MIEEKEDETVVPFKFATFLRETLEKLSSDGFIPSKWIGCDFWSAWIRKFKPFSCSVEDSNLVIFPLNIFSQCLKIFLIQDGITAKQRDMNEHGLLTKDQRHLRKIIIGSFYSCRARRGINDEVLKHSK